MMIEICLRDFSIITHFTLTYLNDFDSIKELHLTPNKTSVILINIELTIICKQLSE